MDNWTRLNIFALIFLSASLAIVGIQTYAISAPSIGATVEPGSKNKSCNFIIYKDGTTYLGLNAQTGVNDYSVTDAALVTRSILGLTGSQTICFKDGTFVFSSVTATNIILDLLNQATRTITFRGIGIDSTILQLGSSLGAARYFISRSTSSNPIKLFVSDLTLDWNGDNQDYTGVSSEQVNGIYLVNANYSIVERVRFNTFYMKNGGATTFGIGFNSFSGFHTTIRDAFFEDSDWGIWATNPPVNNDIIDLQITNPIALKTRQGLIKTEAGSDITIERPRITTGTQASQTPIDLEPTAANVRNYKVVNPLIRDPSSVVTNGIFINANVLNVEILYPEIDSVNGAGILSNAFYTKILGGKIFSVGTSIASSSGKYLLVEGTEVKSTAQQGIQSSASLTAVGVIAHDSFKDGIDLRVANNTIIGGSVYGNGVGNVAFADFGIGIHFNGATRTLITGVIVFSNRNGIGEDSQFTPDGTIIRNNRLANNIESAIGIVGVNTVVRDNIGYVTEAFGAVTGIDCATTGVKTSTVTHGLAGSPDLVSLTIQTVSDEASRFTAPWADTIGATTFVFNIAVTTAGAGGCTLQFYWYAEFDPA